MEHRTDSLNTNTRVALTVAAIAFALRLAAIPLSITQVNSYSRADATQFAATAAYTANALASGQIPLIRLSDVYSIWGGMLSPFWLFPGPSIVYAHIATSTLGALAVYNVVVMGIRLHSRRAGVIAALPIAVFPSFVLIHASLLRESAVLFALTSVARLWFAPSERLRTRERFPLAVVFLGAAIVLRTENIILYAIVIGVAVGAVLLERDVIPFPQATVTMAGATALAVAAVKVPSVIEYLVGIRKNRARGRTIYLAEVFPDGVLELVAFSWVGAVYFLFTPFPWMVTTAADIVVAVEALVTLGFAIAAVYGVREAAHEEPAVTTTLVIGLLVGAVLYGVANANYGTAIRQRQMFTWILYLFGGIGLAKHVRIHF